jgi:hypothetical protein
MTDGSKTDEGGKVIAKAHMDFVDISQIGN